MVITDLKTTTRPGGADSDKKMRQFKLFAILALLMLAPRAASAEWFFDTETGAAFSGYNDVRIPSDSGTLFSLSEDLDANPTWFVRLRLGATIAQRHTISALAAPLSFHSRGRFDHDVDFAGEKFLRGEAVRGFYRFDSYRLTYRYDFLLEPLELGAGVTGKIRDAEISLDGAEYQNYTNTGVVPLINFRLFWPFVPGWGMLFDGDALVGPQGRAEDIQVALTADLSDRVGLRAGYRMLEGGADNDKVYTFALIHYALLGLTAKF